MSATLTCPAHAFSRGNSLLVGPPSLPVFPRTRPRATPCVPPDPRARFSSRRPARLPPSLSPVGSGDKHVSQVGATRGPSCRRGSRARPASGSGRAAGAPPPGRGVASGPSARLNNAFWPIHRRGLGAPGPDEGCPLWRHVARWTREPWAIHPLRCPGLDEGSSAVTNPQKSPRFCDSVPRRWTRLECLGVGHGSLPWPVTAQQPNP